MNHRPTMAILIGIQGSGKSTFYHKFLESEYVRVNLDSLHTRRKEQLLIEDCLAKCCSFAIDNTNPTKADRARYIALAKQHDYQIVGYLLESKLQACIARNNMRTGAERIPAKAIAATSNKLELPSYSEGFDKLYFVSNDGASMTISEWRENNDI